MMMNKCHEMSSECGGHHGHLKSSMVRRSKRRPNHLQQFLPLLGSDECVCVSMRVLLFFDVSVLFIHCKLL